jgi:hypothetical protein
MNIKKKNSTNSKIDSLLSALCCDDSVLPLTIKGIRLKLPQKLLANLANTSNKTMCRTESDSDSEFETQNPIRDEQLISFFMGKQREARNSKRKSINAFSSNGRKDS